LEIKNFILKYRFFFGFGAAWCVFWVIFAAVLWPDASEVDLDNRLDAFRTVTESDELWFKGMEVHRNGKLNRAIQLYTEAHELRPDATMPLLFRARAAFENGDFQSAIDDCNAILEEFPDDSPAQNMRGLAKYGAGDFDGAIADFEELMKLRKNFHWPFINRALVINDKDGIEAGIREFEIIAERFGQIPRIFDSLGVLTYQMGDKKKALEYFNMAAEKSDKYKYAFPHTFLNRSQLRYEMGDSKGALEDRKKYEKLFGVTNK